MKAHKAKYKAYSEQPNLHLTPEERRYFGQLFSSADTDKLGVVTGETAVKFFEKTRLSSDVLGEIWQIADTENRGLLTPAGFGIVLRLIGYAQAGRQVSTELALKRKCILSPNITSVAWFILARSWRTSPKVRWHCNTTSSASKCGSSASPSQRRAHSGAATDSGYGQSIY